MPKPSFYSSSPLPLHFAHEQARRRATQNLAKSDAHLDLPEASTYPLSIAMSAYSEGGLVCVHARRSVGYDPAYWGYSASQDVGLARLSMSGAPIHIDKEHSPVGEQC